MNDQQTSEVLSLPRPLKQQPPQLHLIETCPDRVDHLPSYRKIEQEILEPDLAFFL